MRIRHWQIALVGLLGAALFAGTLAWGQAAATAGVKGVVIDPEGKPIVGAEVVFTHVDSGRATKLKTDKRGEYLSLGLTPGTYDITLMQGGKVLAERKGATLVGGLYGNPSSEGFRNTFDFRFKTGSASEEAKKAQEEFEKAKAGYDRGVAFNRAGKFQEALADLLPLLEKDPNLWMVHAQIGVAYDGLNRLDDAEASYKKALALNPSEALLYNNLGRIYLKQKRTEEARKQFETAAQLSPEDASIFYFNLAVSFYNNGDLKSAIEPLKKVVELDPNHANAHFFLGVCLYSNAESKIEGGEVKTVLLPGTVENFQRYLELDPNGRYVADAKQYLQIIEAQIPAAVRVRKK